MSRIDENSDAPTIDVPFKFRRKPVAIAPDFRKDWKIAVLLLILEISSRAGKSSLKRLHVLNWAVRTLRHQAEFEQARNVDAPLFAFKVRFEPAFSRAIEFAEAQNLVSWVEGDRVQITPLGQGYAKALIKGRETLAPEIAFLTRIGKSVSEADATRLLTGDKTL